MQEKGLVGLFLLCLINNRDVRACCLEIKELYSRATTAGQNKLVWICKEWWLSVVLCKEQSRDVLWGQSAARHTKCQEIIFSKCRRVII